jgi:hypothetical protein
MKLWDRIRYEIDLRERLRWAPHNCFHPLLVFLPRSLGDFIHDLTVPRDVPRIP